MSEENKNRPIWQIDSTHPELVEPVTEALREIVDPEIGLNIIQLGLIRDIQIEDEQRSGQNDPDHALLPLRPGDARNHPPEGRRSLESAHAYGPGHGYVGFFDDGRRPGGRLGSVLSSMHQP